MQITKKQAMLKRLWQDINVGLIIIQSVMGIFLIACTSSFNVFNKSSEIIINVIIDCFILLLTILMYISCMRTEDFNKLTVSFSVIIAFSSFYTYFDAFAWLVDGNSVLRKVCFVDNTFYYIFGILLSWMFWVFSSETVKTNQKMYKQFNIVVASLAIIGLILVAGNCFYNYYFTVDEFGYYQRTAGTYPLSTVFPTLILLISTIFIFTQKANITDKITLSLYPLMPFGSIVATMFGLKTSLTTAFTFAALLLVYSNLYVHREKELAEKEKQLAESKMNSMLLQINPHFIYNTLGSVSSLCASDPEKARNVLKLFSNYLRNNFGELSQKSLIPLRTEIEHLKLYIEIEKTRFPDINVELDIQIDNFNIPSLSVQPLVENAITHGIMGRECGGTVKISSYDDEKYYHVVVEDDGVGFTELPTNDKRNHIGINNVRNRINMLCGGKLLINSTVDVGTVAEIRIPKKEKVDVSTLR